MATSGGVSTERHGHMGTMGLQGREGMARAQQATRLISFSSLISFMACSLLRLRRSPSILQIFSLVISELQVCWEGLL